MRKVRVLAWILGAAGIIGFLALAYGGWALVDDYRLRVSGAWTGVDAAEAGAAAHLNNVRNCRLAKRVAMAALAIFLSALGLLAARNSQFRRLGWLTVFPVMVPVLPASVFVLGLKLGSGYQCLAATGPYDRGQRCLRYSAGPPHEWLLAQGVDAGMAVAFTLQLWLTFMLIVWVVGFVNSRRILTQTRNS